MYLSFIFMNYNVIYALYLFHHSKPPPMLEADCLKMPRIKTFLFGVLHAVWADMNLKYKIPLLLILEEDLGE